MVVTTPTSMKSDFKIKQSRSFSESLRRQIVGQIVRKELTIASVSREYNVSRASIYNWLYLYSSTLKQGIRMVMEKDSQEKLNQELRKQIKGASSSLRSKIVGGRSISYNRRSGFRGV